MLKYEHVNVAVSRTNILNDINITFPKGQITTIIGPNGCGKTTLLHFLILALQDVKQIKIMK